MNIAGLGSVPFVSVSALDAFATGMQATAHNIANVNTAGFQPQAVYYADLPPHMGVRVGDITGPGPTAPRPDPDAVTFPRDPGVVTFPAPEQPIGVLPPPPDDLTAPVSPEQVNPAYTAFMPPEMLNPSNTSLETEMVHMMIAQRAYEANVVPVQAWNEMTGTLIDIKT